MKTTQETASVTCKRRRWSTSRETIFTLYRVVFLGVIFLGIISGQKVLGQVKGVGISKTSIAHIAQQFWNSFQMNVDF